MSISLFEHNEKAYRSALDILGETGKAAIVHPTGTGKSFIAFKLCEDVSPAIVCWLSPSDYIFKTQIENIKKTFGCYPPNIKFFTYAKLMLASKEEIERIKPEYIILDEFHRCGAEMWGAGVKALLDFYPHVPILGLSATAIRYLDNQRDMSDELFDQNIASNISLGEAIVRGILPAPKYILTVYSYNQELEKYAKKIKVAKNAAAKNKAQIRHR